ncbi:MAG TPA: hypothetical protein VM325_19525 [Alphaproteobacteria bacterium]|nr:hypothetical protein [Alphaproteobacteria bacterium]
MIDQCSPSNVCAMVEGKLPGKGFVRQEQCKLDDFLANRFGAQYA